mgnify:FL=1
MKDSLHIAFSGACCVGKTTLINILSEEYKDFTIQRESVRYLKDKYGLDFRSGDTGLQMALLHLQTKFLMSSGKYLLDRTSLDSLAYSRWYKAQGNSDIPSNVFAYMEEESKKNLIERVDLVIFLRPEIPLIADGTRIVDKEYQLGTDKIMEDIIKECGIENKVIQPHGTPIERALFCKKYIDELIAKRS